jgi:hypothetical protein
MIVHLLDHWIVPEKLEQARDLFAANTKVICKIPELVARHVLQSRKDPLKWTTVAIWEDESGAKAWDAHPEHIWDRYGYDLVCPPDTEYYNKYAKAGTVHTKRAVGEVFDVITSNIMKR